jgi:hypothetical protein
VHNLCRKVSINVRVERRAANDQTLQRTFIPHYQKFDDKLEGKPRHAVSEFNRSRKDTSAPSKVSRAAFFFIQFLYKRHPRVSLTSH